MKLLHDMWREDDFASSGRASWMAKILGLFLTERGRRRGRGRGGGGRETMGWEGWWSENVAFEDVANSMVVDVARRTGGVHIFIEQVFERVQEVAGSGSKLGEKSAMKAR